MAIRTLDWRDPLEFIDRATTARINAVPLYLHEPIDRKLMSEYGIDIHEPRQLHAVFGGLIMMTQYLIVKTILPEQREQFGLTEEQGSSISLAIALMAGELAMKLKVFIPAEVRRGKKRVRVYGEPLDPLSLKWSALRPESLSRTQLYDLAETVQRITGRDVLADLGKADDEDCAVEFIHLAMGKLLLQSPGVTLERDDISSDAIEKFEEAFYTPLLFSLRAKYRDLAFQ